jgi:gliding motility-associated-like protein
MVTITVQPSPMASFTANPLTGTPPLTVNFANSSQNANTYIWTFGNGNTSSSPSPNNIYAAIGTYTVTLVASDNGLCPSTATATIIVVEDFTLMIPNIFTPDGDGKNDVFTVTATGVESFAGTIYDRWGLKLFEWDEASKGWDGSTKSGAQSVDGTYFYIITVKGGKDANPQIYKGFVQLLK